MVKSIKHPYYFFLKKSPLKRILSAFQTHHDLPRPKRETFTSTFPEITKKNCPCSDVGNLTNEWTAGAALSLLFWGFYEKLLYHQTGISLIPELSSTGNKLIDLLILSLLCYIEDQRYILKNERVNVEPKMNIVVGTIFPCALPSEHFLHHLLVCKVLIVQTRRNTVLHQRSTLESDAPRCTCRSMYFKFSSFPILWTRKYFFILIVYT